MGAIASWGCLRVILRKFAFRHFARLNWRFFFRPTVRRSICTLVQAAHTDVRKRRNEWNFTTCNFPKLVIRA